MEFEEFEKRIAQRKKEQRVVRDQRSLAELATVLEVLEANPGAKRIHEDNGANGRLATPPDLPGFVIVKPPTPMVMKAFRYAANQTQGKTVDEGRAKAIPQLAYQCVIYPSKELYEKMCEALPGIADAAGTVALALGEGAEEAEGKG
jgi:hypothetical protein